MAPTDAHSANDKGILYVVATPIGNFKDITERAVETLRSVDIILAEDTRRTKPLLQRLGIGKPLVKAFHEHNEDRSVQKILDELTVGKNIALVSDAGTPLISDPGYSLVSAAHGAELQVVPIPGACAAITALSVSGMPTNQFFFAGFLPAKSTQRCKSLKVVKEQVGTLVFYESSHRIVASLEDCLAELGDRTAVMARELTKMYETLFKGTLSELLDFVKSQSNQQKGEFVLLIEGAEQQYDSAGEVEIDELLKILMKELSLKRAVSVTAEILALKKNTVYERALELKDRLE